VKDREINKWNELEGRYFKVGVNTGRGWLNWGWGVEREEMSVGATHTPRDGGGVAHCDLLLSLLGFSESQQRRF
jgi:hypothetical protein